jgi:prepilin-type N-terminal cleavage/methylation domain-containing protein
MRRELGFTLIEVLVALMIAGIVMLLGHRVFTGVLDGAAHMHHERLALDREANARRFLIDAFGSLDVANDKIGFVGQPHAVTFGTAQLTPDDWPKPRRLYIGLVTDTLIATLDGLERIDLAIGVTTLDLDYLLEPGANTKWVHEWISPVSAPLAVRMRLGYREHADTLLLLIGPRG